jgi:dCMP deaminase
MEEGHCIRTVHAEENTILQAAAVGGVSAEGSTLYTTHSPCYHCTKKILVTGIKRVVAGSEYRISDEVKEALKAGGVTLDMYTPNPEWDAKLVEIFAEKKPNV